MSKFWKQVIAGCLVSLMCFLAGVFHDRWVGPVLLSIGSALTQVAIKWWDR